MLNCWEFKKCGRQIEEQKAEELRVCPVASDTSVNGANREQNSGRICRAVAGTFCDGEVQGTFTQKTKNCFNCDFMRMVNQEERAKFNLMKPAFV